MSDDEVHLLDSNVLIALVIADHQHHDRARRWFRSTPVPVATCPTVEGSLLRLAMREGATAARAQQVLRSFSAHPRHRWWSDDVRYVDADLRHVRGHRQVTDAYLAQLARSRGGRVVTMDAGLALAAPDVVTRLPG